MSTTTAQPQPGRQTPAWGVGRVVTLVCGSVFALVALGLAMAGIALVLAHATARDSNGYYTSSTQRFTTSTFALTSERMQIGDVRGDGANWALDALDATVRVRASAPDGRPIFVGIALKADVDRYLARSAHAVVSNVSATPFTYRSVRARRPDAAGDADDADLLGREHERLGHAGGDMEAERRALGGRRHERRCRPVRAR